MRHGRTEQNDAKSLIKKAWLGSHLDTPLSDTAKDLLEDIVEDTEEHLKSLTVNALRSKLKEHGLSTKGKKAELVERLLNGIEN